MMYWALLLAGSALTGLSVSSLLLRKPAPVKTAVMVLAILVAFYQIEFALWFLGIDLGDRLGMHFARLLKQGMQVDLRTPVQVIMDMRGHGVRPVPLLSPSETLHGGIVTTVFPLAGVSRAVTVLCNENGHYVTYTSDEHGFRNPQGLWGQGHPLNTAVMGDSFANGGCVQDGEELASHVRKRFPATINLGIGGTGPLIQLAIMREYLPYLRPRLVLWFYYENDLGDLETELGNSFLRQYLDPRFSQDLIHRQGEVDSYLTDLIEDHLRRSHARPPAKQSPAARALLLARVRRLMASPFERPPAPAPVIAETYAQIVGIANKLVTTQGGKLHLIYLPDWVRMNRSADDPHYRQKERVLAAAAQSKLPVIDVHATFRAYPAPASRFFEYPGSHYNARGYQVAAEYVLERIENNR